MPLKLSNDDFATSIGVHYSMVSRLRSGERTPSLSTFADIAKEFRWTNQQIADALESYRQGTFHDFLNAVVFGDGMGIPRTEDGAESR